MSQYRGRHQAPGPRSGAPGHDLTKYYPSDIYGWEVQAEEVT